MPQFTRAVHKRLAPPDIPEIELHGAHNFISSRTDKAISVAAYKIVKIIGKHPDKSFAFVSTVLLNKEYVPHAFVLTFSATLKKVFYECCNTDVLTNPDLIGSPLIKLVQKVAKVMGCKAINLPKDTETEEKAIEYTGEFSSTTGWCFAYARFAIQRNNY